MRRFPVSEDAEIGMNYFPVPTVVGIDKDMPERMLREDKASDGLNVMFNEGVVEKRYGRLQIGQQLNGRVMNMMWYEPLHKGLGQGLAIAFTVRDVYYYDTLTKVWKFLTKNYNEGTATVDAGVATITGTLERSWYPHVAQVAFGTDNMNNEAAIWHDVASFILPDKIILKDDSVNIGETSFVLRLCFSGTEDEHFYTTTPMHSAHFDKVVVVTNGIDPVQIWDGDTGKAFRDIEPIKIAKWVGYYGSAGAERLFLSHISDGAIVYPQTIELSDVGNPESFSGVFYALANTPERIEGAVQLGQSLFFYKKSSITEVQPSGNAADPLRVYQDKISYCGTVSIKTVQDIGGAHIFLGQDNVYVFDGMTAKPLGAGLEKYITGNINKRFAERFHSFLLRERNLYCLCACLREVSPEVFFCFNYMSAGWTIWDMKLGSELMASSGLYKPYDSKTWEQILEEGTTWTQQLSTNFRWADFIIEGAPVALLGGSDGNVYALSTYNDDNGQPVDCTVTTRDFPLSDPKHAVKLLEVLLTSHRAGAVTVEASVDFGVTYQDVTNIFTEERYQEGVYNYILRGKQARLRIKSNNGEPFKIESVIMGYANTGLEARK
ncbi:MAG: hypothetical protein FWG92_02410 [Leptospirales bacterium]|nr:hypothetical protein [Leptospirales bacterium]